MFFALKFTSHSFNSLQVFFSTISPANSDCFPKRQPEQGESRCSKVVEYLEGMNSSFGAENQADEEEADCDEKREFSSMSLEEAFEN